MTTILITGTGRGIGLELARQALARGWTVYGSARSEVTDKAAHICDHPQFHDLRFDVTDHEAVRAAAADIVGPIDILINNAGIIGPERQGTLDMDFDGFARTLAVNTLGAAGGGAGLPAAPQAQREPPEFSLCPRRWDGCPTPSPTISPTGRRRRR